MHSARGAPAPAIPRTTAAMIVALCIAGFSLMSVQMGLNGTFQAVFAEGSPRLSRDEIGILVSVNYLGAMLGAPLFGRLSDAIGRRRPLAAAVAVVALGSAALEFSASYPQLIASRLLGGIGVGGYLAIVFTYFVELLPANWRGPSSFLTTAIGSLAALSAVFAMRAIVAGDPQGWRTVFLAAGGIAAIVGALMIAFLPESEAWRATRRNAGETAKPRPAGLLGAHRRPFLTFMTANLMIPLPLSGFFLTVGLIVLARHYDAQTSLQVTGVASAGSVVGLLGAAFIANRVARAHLIAGACAISVASIVVFALVAAPIVAMIAAAGVMLGSGLAYIALSLYTAESFPNDVRGRATGIIVGANRLMTVLVPLTLTYAISRIGEGIALILIALGLVVVADAVLRFHHGATSPRESVDI